MRARKNSPSKVERPLSKRRRSVKNRREQGIALITTLLILLLLSTMIVGIAWLVTGDQKLGGNNSDRQLAFYGAEAGMESLTASLENLFDSNPAPNAAAINALMTTPGPPANIPNVQYIAPGTNTPGSGYQIAANAAFVSAAPRDQRSQAFGLAQGGMSLGQGTLMILAGAAADHFSPAWVIAVCGTIGAVVALAIAVSWARERRRPSSGRLEH